ncbi:MarR family transcriptional regulator with acetyltransferase activity [Roseiarcus fermentans]|uniref:MarR family transcriptional regulator with acetyltransferase activity n=1 Tax=Roseiarcus fermentans TaxID=1473586 RepID=A0A366FBT6_9HYPH|nr:helix-turn-helix domain-containing GNAT family N-acetyltransferase [Roseiarcus fermentans]RBP11219.1 MarR family transcriptional regulator with acetyltransferase activity [Roseiarcus fermentans]
MDTREIAQVRRFNRVVTQAVGALDQSYLERGRPLGEARLLFEIGADGAEARALRARLGLDAGYLSRLLRSLEAQGLIEVVPGRPDARRRRASATTTGRAEIAAYDALSDRLAASLLAPLDPARRARLVAAMGEVERLLSAAAVEIAPEPPASAEAQWCLGSYFRELADRFEGGFDPAADRSAPAADLAPPNGLFILARLGGEPVGCGALKRIDDATGEIKRVWTAPPARGLGLARRILDRLEAEAGRMGFAVLRLDTNKALTEAHALYLKAGYREIGRFNDNPYAHRWFEKRLAG